MASDPAAARDQMTAEEIAAALDAVRDRVRARFPQGSTPDKWHVPLPDLMPVVHARDKAESKVASIGKVNPRPGGPLNAVVQWGKNLISRSLNWHVREQVEFNRHVIESIEALTQALNENNRSLIALSGRAALVHEELSLARDTERSLADLRFHWDAWRRDWENKLSLNESQYLRSTADLNASFHLRATTIESSIRDTIKLQHVDYLASIAKATADLQTRFWNEIAAAQRQYEKLIHEELRITRQRLATQPAPAAPAPAAPPLDIDYGRFAERFRGPESYVRKNVEFYLPHFRGRTSIVDLGCGRGEFLSMLRDNSIPARGVELSAESVNLCRARGLDVEESDLFDFLDRQPDRSLDGIFCAQVVEHLAPAHVPRLVALASRKLAQAGILAIETPNPECLAIFATHFFLDPTHTRPIPHPLLAFYYEESGLGAIEVHKLSPAIDSMPALASLPEAFRDAFFGGLDYAIIAAKL